MDFKEIEWSPFVAANLSKALGDDEDIIATEVRTGISQCWLIDDHSLVVSRFEVKESTLVLVAGQGKGLAQVVTVFEQVARTNNIKNMRIHSAKKGVGRMLEKLHYKVSQGINERIFTKRVI